MSNPVPWLTIIGIGEDGLKGLSAASQTALDAAENIFGGPRHLELAGCQSKGTPWPVPFSVDPVLACKGQPTVMLVSGDPFWYGAGSVIAAHLAPEDWQCFSSPSCVSLAAAQLGWRLEEVLSLGLHAAPFEQLLPVLGTGQRIICTLRDGAAPAKLAAWLTDLGFGATQLHVFERLGGPHQRHRSCLAAQFNLTDITAPVTVALEAQASGQAGFIQAPGRAESLFSHDGQITKAPIRAMTLAALQPRSGDVLWDLGAGSGSVSVEFLLCAARTRAVCVETRKDRSAHIAENARRFGLAHRMEMVSDDLRAQLETLGQAGQPQPSVIFIGGGAKEDVLQAICDKAAPGTRLVVNAVTLETESLLVAWQARKGGHLLKCELSSATPLGSLRGWDRARPVVQWSVIL